MVVVTHNVDSLGKSQIDKNSFELSTCNSLQQIINKTQKLRFFVSLGRSRPPQTPRVPPTARNRAGVFFIVFGCLSEDFEFISGRALRAYHARSETDYRADASAISRCSHIQLIITNDSQLKCSKALQCHFNQY